MSHYCEVQIELRDEAALVAALTRLGFRREIIEVHQTPQTLYGYQGDARPQKAHIIIRRKYVGRAANDLGFERQADGRYRVWVSEYDQAHNGYNNAWLGRLKQAYGIEKARAEAKKRGYRLTEQKLDDGTIRLVLRR
ncbi:MAG: DUF1257 domain-containing protein [Candidatus Hadarchaeum sp.]